jgi:hypothetical protein
MRLRLSDSAYLERLATFLTSVGVATAPGEGGVLDLQPEVDQDELAIYLRVWGVLNPEGAAVLEAEG